VRFSYPEGVVDGALCDGSAETVLVEAMVESMGTLDDKLSDVEKKGVRFSWYSITELRNECASLKQKLDTAVVERDQIAQAAATLMGDMGELKNDRDTAVLGNQKLGASIAVLLKENDSLQTLLEKSTDQVQEMDARVQKIETQSVAVNACKCPKKAKPR
jgi:chromosome segregation ATPase